MRRAVVGALVAVAGLVGLPGCGPSPNTDALHTKVRAELAVFTDWLDRFDERGFIGEIGWPDDNRGEAARWNALAETWFRDADAAGLWVTSWTASRKFPSDYPLAIYEDRRPGGGVDTPGTQAQVVERHRRRSGARRGVNTGGGEWHAPQGEQTSGYSNVNRGVFGVDYDYEPASSFAYLASRGIGTVRIGVRWERLQPNLTSPLDRREVRRLRRVIRQAEVAGLKVVVDLHNFGAYYLFDGFQGVRRPIGSAEVPVPAFTDLWSRLSRQLAAEPALVGYGLMNEPVGLPGAAERDKAVFWELVSQTTLDAIRARGDTTTVMVSGYFFSNAQLWPRFHPNPWITDPADNFLYEAHQYFNATHTGRYEVSYADELAMAEAAGFRP